LALPLIGKHTDETNVLGRQPGDKPSINRDPAAVPRGLNFRFIAFVPESGNRAGPARTQEDARALKVSSLGDQ
jgi:hypothetical protein